MKTLLTSGIVVALLTACVTQPVTEEERRLKSWKTFTADARLNCAIQTEAFGSKKGYTSQVDFSFEQVLAWKLNASADAHKEHEKKLGELLNKDSAYITQIVSEVRTCMDNKATPEQFSQVSGYSVSVLKDSVIDASAKKRDDSKTESCYTETISSQTPNYHCDKNCERWDDIVEAQSRKFQLGIDQIAAGYYIKKAEGHCSGSDGCGYFRPSKVSMMLKQTSVEWVFKTWSTPATVGLDVTVCKAEI